MTESKFTHEEMQPMKVEYGENLSMTDISERLRGLVPHYEDPSDYTEDDLLIYQGANLIEAYKDEILRLRNTLDQTRRFALSGEMDKIASDEIERLRKILNEQSDAHVEHVRGLNEQNTIREDVYKKQIERLREALRKCLPLLSRAHDRIHVLPRATDGELAKDIDVMLGSIRAALREGE